MSITFKILQDEVARRSTKDQGGMQFTIAIKNTINFSLFRLGREAPWRVLRRKSSFDTVTSYTKGTGFASATTSSPNVTITGATFLTDNVAIGRFVKFQGSGDYYKITQITGETTLVLDKNWQSTTNGSLMTYEILPQEEYNLPIEASHRMFMWHYAFGYPFKMNYITDQDFIQKGVYQTIKYLPTHYRMWNTDWVIKQLTQPSIISIASSSSVDTSISVSVFGIVSGYPDTEVLVTNSSNGTTTVNGSKIFSSVERIVKGTYSIGRITATANSANDVVSILPTGDTTSGIQYKKVQLYGLPNKVFPIYVQYYKDPYRLVADGDVHELGQEFDEAIILLSVAKLKAEQNLQTEADRFFAFYKDELSSLKQTNCDKIDWFPTLRRPKNTATDMLVTSNLLFRQAGPFFGPSSRF
jgi:hypothetical protein